MKALQRFEDWVSQLLEGGLVGRLGARMQPVDIARRLADHMADHRTIGAGRVYVPNNFRVYLAPATLAGFAGFKGRLEEELAAFLAARARETDLHHVGRVRVLLLADPALKPARMRIESDLVDRRGVVIGPGGDRTEALPVAQPVEPPQAFVPATLTLLVGNRRIPLPWGETVTLGRALDNTVILDDSSISRQHARLAPRGTHWMIEDCGSTQGVFINSHRVSASLLRPGDRVQLGRVVIRVEAEEGTAPA